MGERTLRVNGKDHRVDVDDNMPLLWVLRDVLGLTGTKYGCGRGLCRSCTVHIGGRAAPSCLLPVSSVGAEVTTIEGLAARPDHPVLEAWRQVQVPQCGYCQPGQIMGAAALLADVPQPSDEEIDRRMAGHLCRCGTYNRIRKAIHRAARRSLPVAAPGPDGGRR